MTFAVAWTLTRDFVGSTLVGATSAEQLDESLAAADVTLGARGAGPGRRDLPRDPLSDGLMRALARFAVAASLALLAPGCGCGPRLYDGEGTVTEVRADLRQVVIDHEDIEGLMPAMTMNFDVADPLLLEGLAPGTHVHFRLASEGESYRIVEIAAVGAAGSAGVAGRAAPRAAGSRRWRRSRSPRRPSSSSTRTARRAASPRCGARPCCWTSSTRTARGPARS